MLGPREEGSLRAQSPANVASGGVASREDFKAGENLKLFMIDGMM